MSQMNHSTTPFSLGYVYRFAIGHTETQAGIDALDFAELAAVLAVFQERVRMVYSQSEGTEIRHRRIRCL